MTTATNPRTDVPAPAGATWVSEWLPCNAETTVARWFRGTRRGGEIHVEICAIQIAEGRIEFPSVTISSVHHDRCPGSIEAPSRRHRWQRRRC